MHYKEVLKMKKKRFLMVLILFLLILVIFPYIYVETQTIIYGDETQDLYKQTNMISDNNYQKVFMYNSKQCNILYADNSTINMCTFKKDNKNEWCLESWKTIKSQQGSADSFIYPYYSYLHEN